MSAPKPGEPAAAGKKPLVVVEVNGGVVQMVYTDDDVDVVLVDWDNINEGDGACLYGTNPLSDMPDDTREQLDAALQEPANDGSDDAAT